MALTRGCGGYRCVSCRCCRRNYKNNLTTMQVMFYALILYLLKISLTGLSVKN